MNTAAVDIAGIIENHFSGYSIGGNLFVGKEPSHPDNCITVFDTPGFGPDLDVGGSSGYYRPSVQVRVRGNDYRSTWAIIDEVKGVLHGLKTTIGSTRYEAIICSIEPALLEWDRNNRAVFVTTFNIQRKEI